MSTCDWFVGEVKYDALLDGETLGLRKPETVGGGDEAISGRGVRRGFSRERHNVRSDLIAAKKKKIPPWGRPGIR